MSPIILLLCMFYMWKHQTLTKPNCIREATSNFDASIVLTDDHFVLKSSLDWQIIKKNWMEYPHLEQV